MKIIKKISPHTLIGAFAVMTAALFWSIDGLFIRPQFYSLPADLIVFLEHALGFVVLAPFIFFSWPKIRALTCKSWAAVAWVSLFGGLIGTIMITKAFFAALDGSATFATVVLIQKLQPIFALILARVLLHEKLPEQFYRWTILAVLASYFMVFGKSGFNLSDINIFHNAAVFALLAAFSFGSSTVFGKRLANHLDYKAAAALRFGVTAVMGFILVIMNGTIFGFSDITLKHWSLFVLIVFTSGAGAMFIYYFGLRRISASAATILELFWPLSALILDYVFNKNYLNITQACAALVLLFVFFKISSLDNPKMTFKAHVVHGQGRGRSLGFPTANLDNIDLDIPHGIYVVSARIRGKDYSALMHFGFKEVFNEAPSQELLIKDFSGDIYGEEVQIKVDRRIRDIKKFASPALLAEAIKEDLKALA